MIEGGGQGSEKDQICVRIGIILNGKKDPQLKPYMSRKVSVLAKTDVVAMSQKV